MTQEKYFTVMELAERVGVPRTTINDWLSRYAPYMDFIMQGKRRVYSENTLSVLQRISQLRASGSSSFQIENELASSYAVHPEAADEPASAPSSGEQTKPAEGRAVPGVSSSPEPEASAAPASPETALVRNPAEDPALLLGERFREMLEKMDALEKRSRAGVHRAWLFFSFAVILTVLLGAACVIAHRLFRNMEREARTKNDELVRLTGHAAALTSDAQSMREQLRTLQSGLAAQEKEFRAALEENRASYEKRREAELSAQKDRFAAERLELVRRYEASQKESEERWKKETDEALRLQKKEQETALLKQAEDLKKKAEEEKALIIREREAELERVKKETQRVR